MSSLHCTSQVIRCVCILHAFVCTLCVRALNGFRVSADVFLMSMNMKVLLSLLVLVFEARQKAVDRGERAKLPSNRMEL